MRPLALYGLLRSRPRWWIYWRGREWLRMGYCPCCYSSPPLLHCPICAGEHRYGRDLEQLTRLRWRLAWQVRARHTS